MHDTGADAGEQVISTHRPSRQPFLTDVPDARVCARAQCPPRNAAEIDPAALPHLRTRKGAGGGRAFPAEVPPAPRQHDGVRWTTMGRLRKRRCGNRPPSPAAPLLRSGGRAAAGREVHRTRAPHSRTRFTLGKVQSASSLLQSHQCAPGAQKDPQCPTPG